MEKEKDKAPGMTLFDFIENLLFLSYHIKCHWKNATTKTAKTTVSLIKQTTEAGRGRIVS